MAIILFKTILLLLCFISVFSQKKHELHFEMEATTDDMVFLDAKKFQVLVKENRDLQARISAMETMLKNGNNQNSSNVNGVHQARQDIASDIVELGGRKYLFITKQKGNWFEASTYCNLLGMALVSIETEEENNLIMEHVEKLGLHGWILTGGNKIGQNDYAWISGAPLTFKDWNRGDPASFHGEHCLMLDRGHWSDLGCEGWRVSFICEQI